MEQKVDDTAIPAWRTFHNIWKREHPKVHKLVKARHRISNVCTPDQLLHFIATCNDLVSLVDVTKTGGFRDWYQFQNKHYKELDHFQQYHVFTAFKSHPCTLYMDECAGKEGLRVPDD